MQPTTFANTAPRPLRLLFPRRYRHRHRRSGTPTLTPATAASSTATANNNLMKILYCTGNAGKFKEASFVFEEFNKRGGTVVEIVQVDADPVEIQGSAEEIGLSKVKEAVRILRAKGAIPEGRPGGGAGRFKFVKEGTLLKKQIYCCLDVVCAFTRVCAFALASLVVRHGLRGRRGRGFEPEVPEWVPGPLL